MKKKCLTIIVTCLIFIFILGGCGSAQNGVPDSVLLRDTSLDINDADKYTIVHNVDNSAHTDNVTLTAEFKEVCGTTTITAQYIYQYDQTNDLWELLNEGNQTENTKLNKKSIISHSPYTGRAVNPFFYTNYSITFTDIDLEKMTAKIQYTFSSSMSGVNDVTNTITVNLQGSASNPYFVIPYTVSNGNGGIDNPLGFTINIYGVTAKG